MLRISDLSVGLSCTAQGLRELAARQLGVRTSDLVSLRLHRRSVDARKKDNIRFICAVDVELQSGEAAVLSRCSGKKVSAVVPYRYEPPACPAFSHRPVVVGFGPAGLFAALILAQAGARPIVVERGKEMERRVEDVNAFWQGGPFLARSNVQFGEGGAGTFSDGKLNTGTKDPRARKVLEEFAAAGASQEILYAAKPHIGTDRLRAVVKSLREQILSLGGEVRFETQMTGLKQQKGRLTSLLLEGPQGAYELETGHAILAIGHSARDTFSLLAGLALPMEAKPFSVGARIEHLQKDIDRSQYGKSAGHPALGAADYKLSVHLPSGRGVYTFCMCPGGSVVAAASEEGGVVTNGMSEFARKGPNANAALLVGVGPEDFPGADPLAGVRFQRQLEQAAFQAGGGDYRAPAQRVEDFLKDRPSHRLGTVRPTYLPGVVPGNLEDCLPRAITDAMRQGILQMDRRLRGFAHPDALLTGVETRSSSPVRILRNQAFQSPGVAGLFPCGEGAGYAGGIISAAVDGIRCAEAAMGVAPEALCRHGND